MGKHELLPSRSERALLDSVYPVSRETLERLVCYHELLRQWQAKTNLVGAKTLEQFWIRHVADSLHCLSVHPDQRAWLDLGSGGGFPGMVLALVLAAESQPKHPSRHHLIESTGKKVAFLRTVARHCGAEAVIHQQRIESVAEQCLSWFDTPPMVTARALASLPDLLELAQPLLSHGAVGLFHKGRDYLQEIEDCRGLWAFDLVIHQGRHSEDSVLLEITNLRAGR